MTEEEKDNRIKELEEFLETIIDNVYYYHSPIWDDAMRLLNRTDVDKKLKKWDRKDLFFDANQNPISQFQIDKNESVMSVFDIDHNEITDYKYTDFSGYLTLYGYDVESINVEFKTYNVDKDGRI